jgi:predicted AlkP superfamily pyrophosphatase or phosphodiesterase
MARGWTTLVLLLVAALAGLPSAPAAQSTRPPKLAVLIVVDQMRADYVDRFRRDWTGGLKRLVTDGAWFRRAAYPYLNTVTCVGHATISTGTFPKTHGIIQNAWWDRESNRAVTCTADGNAKTVSYGAAAGGGDSAHRLAVPTWTDVMRTQRNARVVSVSLKDRSAIMMAGHGGAAVTWLAVTGDRWITSSAFATSPVPEVKAFIDAHPIREDYGKTWARLLPPGRYRQPDDTEGEVPPSGWTRTFPHVLSGTGASADALFYAQWQRSPYANAYLAQFAATLVKSMSLGQGQSTDVLAISFSSTDLVGHAFGPDSQEVQDMYAQLDQAIGALLTELDTLVGRDQFVVALSADHGVTPMPEHLLKDGHDAGRLSAVNLASFINTRVQAELGEGRYVSRLNGNDVYFEPGMYDRLASNPSAMNAVLRNLRRSEGIANVYPAESVRSGANSKDPLLKAAALSFFPGRSGDLVLVPKPGWMSMAAGTTHGSGNADDQRVPVVIFGPGVKPGVYDDQVTPADIAPTLAELSGFTLQNVDGHVLTSALGQR